MILPVVDLLLAIVAAALWRYVLTMPPVAPTMPLFPVRPTYHPMLRELQTAPRFLAYASACAPMRLAVERRAPGD